MRYGVIRTQIKEGADVRTQPLHILSRGTLVRVLRPVACPVGIEVETMYPVFGSWYEKYCLWTQIVDRDDFYELPQWLGPLLEWIAPKFQRTREWLGWA
ncbi:hypothetical protein WJ32_29195 [Burkholderia ubonensis]|uniref:Uncharacterized protein n=1 Tax=Burkholderia ubonensis TaxID=101571 RepID=A0A103BL73_9BURK|nr:hypothetical protein [Burkholderia ubonensis]AOJ66445.1 hypothetical protein WJ32_29195 [Burkholderia ubonensis]KVD50737.1 hypothetical protein WI86_16650 [Burkholderia ubonensis]KVG76906.1 hypothetical protein WJ33_11950 [Burkholderia ubonensis]